MNSYAVLGTLLAFAGLGSYAVWERGDAANWHEKFTSLQASYQQTADKAKADAQAQEQKDIAALNLQSSQALSNAQSGKQQAENQLKQYQAKLAAAASDKDDGHRCAGVVIPQDLLPGSK